MSTSNLNSAQRDVLTDDIYFDSLEDLHSPLDQFNANVTDIVQFGDYTFCTSDPTLPYIEPGEGDPILHGTNDQPGHQAWYRHTSGSEINVFVTETEDDGSLPSDHSFWRNFMQPRIERAIYQGVLDSRQSLGINNNDILDEVAPFHPRLTKPTAVDHEALRPFFCYLPTSRIKQSFANCFYHMKMPPSEYLRKRHRSPNPAANVFRRRETDCTDTTFSDTSAIGAKGVEAAQLWVGRNSKFTTVHGLSGLTEEDLLITLQDRVRYHGAPEAIAADNAAVYRGEKFSKYCRDLWIKLWQSESYHQNQNYTKNRMQTMKVMINRLLDFTNAPKCLWLLAALYVAFCLNHTVDSQIGSGDMTPYTFATGRSDDISPLLCFRFYEPVYCIEPVDNQKFPSTSKEIRGRWVGISQTIGHEKTG